MSTAGACRSTSSPSRRRRRRCATLQAIARNSGGGYYEITKSMIEAVPLGMPVPEVTRAANAAVQHAFAAQADVNTAPTAALPLGPQTEWQMASPIVGTVNLENGRDITGAPLPNTRHLHARRHEGPAAGERDDHRGHGPARIRGAPARVPDVRARGRPDEALRLGLRDRRARACGCRRCPRPTSGTSTRRCRRAAWSR